MRKTTENLKLAVFGLALLGLCVATQNAAADDPEPFVSEDFEVREGLGDLVQVSDDLTTITFSAKGMPVSVSYSDFDDFKYFNIDLAGWRLMVDWMVCYPAMKVEPAPTDFGAKRRNEPMLLSFANEPCTKSGFPTKQSFYLEGMSISLSYSMRTQTKTIEDEVVTVHDAFGSGAGVIHGGNFVTQQVVLELEVEDVCIEMETSTVLNRKPLPVHKLRAGRPTAVAASSVMR